MSGTDITLESGLAAVKIGTALLVKFSVWNSQYCREWACGSADRYSAIVEG